jgi:putative tryptophan/tyrosine transport system substrate-binding protein
MRRREFIAGAAAAAMLPTASRAQQSDAMRRIGMLVAEAVEDDPYYEARVSGLKRGLRDLGWIEGQNITLDIHRADPKAADIRKHVEVLLAGRPEVVVTSGGTTTPPMLQATSTIPIVFVAAVDPVGGGFVESLAHPGGNATGFMQFDYSLSAKWLEILKQVAPAVSRAGILRDATTTSGVGQFAVIESVSHALGIDVVPINAVEDRGIESGIGKIARSQNAGLIATTGAAVTGHRDFIIKLAAQYGLPAVYPHRTWADRGGLVSYGADLVAQSKLAAGYVDRILRGEKPADLPVQAPTKYELVVNARTAKAIGLSVPQTILGSADEVIE